MSATSQQQEKMGTKKATEEKCSGRVNAKKGNRQATEEKLFFCVNQSV